MLAQFNKSLLICAAMLLAALNPLHSETDTLSLTQEEAIDLALEQNREITISGYDQEIAERDWNEARGNLLPRLEFSANYNRNLQLPVIFMPEGSPFGDVLDIGSDNAFDANLSLSMPIYQPGLYSGIRAAEKGKDVAREADREKRLEVKANVAQSYNNALIARESKEVLQATLDSARNNLERTRKLFEQGQVSEHEKIRAEVEVENIRPNVQVARDQYTVALNNLKSTIDLDPDVVVEPEDDLEKMDFEPKEDKENLIADNPSIRMLDHQEDMAEERIASERSSFYPSLSAFGNYNYQAEEDDYDFSEYNWVNTSAVGLRLNIPIFSGFTRYQNLQKAEVEASQTRLQRQQTEDVLHIQLNNQKSLIEQAEERISMQENSLDLARRSVEMARANYRAGTSSLLELNDAEIAYKEAQLNYYEAIADYNSSVIEYRQITGSIQE